MKNFYLNSKYKFLLSFFNFLNCNRFILFNIAKIALISVSGLKSNFLKLLQDDKDK